MTQTNNEREAFESWFKTFMPETYSQHVNDEDIEATRQHHSAWLAWQARAQSPISQNEQQEVVAYTDGEGDFITKEMYDEYLKLGFYTECIVPLYTSPPKQAIPTVEQEHCCPECGCHFVGEFPFEYKTKQVSLPDGWVAVPVELLKDITNCFDNVPSRAHVVNGTDENLKRIAQWVNSSDGGYGLYHAVNHYLQSAPKLNEKG